MSWNYRLILHDSHEDKGFHFIGLHEVYYDGEKITGWTETAIDFICGVDEGKDGIVDSLERALRDARERPMLVESELEAALRA